MTKNTCSKLDQEGIYAYMGTIKALTCLLVFILEFSACSTIYASQPPAIAPGIEWLESNQGSSGLWEEDGPTSYRETFLAVTVLGRLGGDSVVIERSLGAINLYQPSSCDYLARKIISVAAYSDMSDYLVEYLAESQNSDGGWGYQRGYHSNVLETALALRALKWASYPNLAVLITGVDRLCSQQNADSGWGFISGDSSAVFFTAQAILTLAMFDGDFNVMPQIRGAVSWLTMQVHADSGFGTGAASNAYETGLALAAIVKGDPLAPEVANAQAYLESNQLPNGSWQDDTYSTAMAIYGLSHIDPDLAIHSGDISFSNPVPSDSEIVTISATVHNGGALTAADILIQVFDGSPEVMGGEEIPIEPSQIGGDITIGVLGAAGDTTIQVQWDTYLLGGDHNICVVVDPLNHIREPDKLNNTAKKSVHVYYPPDLLIDSIVFDPPEPDTLDTVFIRTTVGNAGELTATNVSLQVWSGDPDAGGIPLMGSPYNIPYIAPSGQFTLNLNTGNYFNTDGAYDIYACADKENTIREIDEFNNCLCETLWVGGICRGVSSATGLNLFGLPLQPTDPYTSYGMIPQIPHCNEIDGWDRASQMWISAVDIGGGIIVGDEFTIELQDGFFARATAPGDTDFCGMRVKEHGCTHFETGLNMTSIPNEDACYTAYTLIDDINTCDEAHHWDVALQAWVSAAKIAEGVFVGEDFPVTPSNGYFVGVETGGDWCTHTCDTITNLPDLLVTPADIWLDPNPVQSGDTVGIFVNINNIGNDTAYTPRLDIYMGDPDAGGTPLLGGNLPVDIAPGGASGYYGNYFVFEGSGFVDIYGIADLYNAIPELDENNNQAYQTLQITAAPLAISTQIRDSEQFSAAVTSWGRGSRSLTLNAELVPPPVLRTTLPTELARQPVTTRVTKPSSSQAATKIEDVLIGNHSSSSVTITWITDGSAGGSVHYGTTPSLGLAKSQDLPEGEIHRVVLDGLAESTQYYFEIISGGITDDNQGGYYTFATTKLGAGVPAVIYGRAQKAGTSSPVVNVVVSAALYGGEISSYPLVGLTDSNGIWSLNLGNLKDAATNDVLAYRPGDTLLLELHGGSAGTGADTIFISGSSPQDCGIQEVGVCTGVAGPAGPGTASVPDDYYLSTNYPNPFNLNTIIRFGLPIAGHVELSIYNVIGQKVTDLVDGDYPAGNHMVSWDGRNASGQPVSSGIYFYRVKSGDFAQIKKMLLLK